MIKVYVAGKYNDVSKKEIEKNIRKAETVAKKIASEGIFVYVPHMATAHWDNVNSYEYFTDLHMDFVKNWATDILVIEGWKNSKGTITEIRIAEEMGLNIWYDIDELLAYEKKNKKRLEE